MVWVECVSQRFLCRRYDVGDGHAEMRDLVGFSTEVNRLLKEQQALYFLNETLAALTYSQYCAMLPSVISPSKPPVP